MVGNSLRIKSIAAKVLLSCLGGCLVALGSNFVFYVFESVKIVSAPRCLEWKPIKEALKAMIFPALLVSMLLKILVLFTTFSSISLTMSYLSILKIILISLWALGFIFSDFNLMGSTRLNDFMRYSLLFLSLATGICFDGFLSVPIFTIGGNS
ncbi:hypothetical protein [Candidatus Similichlamydia epinepheli]|uniref:hypothetical protein n=1 Tax=Candidatus Similichlamydia epinepheli TaxID=1903953 RepID=UPI000D351345|nr:hypothetical protein [Candidatus Similichlamydia epinepheli]